jgi:hypothetical protein
MWWFRRPPRPPGRRCRGRGRSTPRQPRRDRRPGRGLEAFASVLHHQEGGGAVTADPQGIGRPVVGVGKCCRPGCRWPRRPRPPRAAPDTTSEATTLTTAPGPGTTGPRAPTTSAPADGPRSRRCTRCRAARPPAASGPRASPWPGHPDGRPHGPQRPWRQQWLRVEFEGPAGKSRVDAWWDGGPQHEVRDEASDDADETSPTTTEAFPPARGRGRRPRGVTRRRRR